MKTRSTSYGYSVRLGRTIINEKEADVIRWIFDSRSSGKRVLAIANELFESGTESFAASKDKAVKKVSSILYNSIYMGDKGFPAIIDPDLFDAVGRLKGKRTKKPRRCRIDELTDPSDALYEYKENEELLSIEKEICSSLDEAEPDIYRLKELILKLAKERYDCIAELTKEN